MACSSVRQFKMGESLQIYNKWSGVEFVGEGGGRGGTWGSTPNHKQNYASLELNQEWR